MWDDDANGVEDDSARERLDVDAAPSGCTHFRRCAGRPADESVDLPKLTTSLGRARRRKDKAVAFSAAGFFCAATCFACFAKSRTSGGRSSLTRTVCAGCGRRRKAHARALAELKKQREGQAMTRRGAAR